MQNLKALMKEKGNGGDFGKSGATNFDIEAGQKPSFLKKPTKAAAKKKSGLAARLTGGK